MIKKQAAKNKLLLLESSKIAEFKRVIDRTIKEKFDGDNIVNVKLSSTVLSSRAIEKIKKDYEITGGWKVDFININDEVYMSFS